MSLRQYAKHRGVTLSAVKKVVQKDRCLGAGHHKCVPAVTRYANTRHTDAEGEESLDCYWTTSTLAMVRGPVRISFTTWPFASTSRRRRPV